MERTRDPGTGFLFIQLTDRVDERSGRLEAATLRAAMAAVPVKGQLHVALDLAPVRVMDAEALGELAAACKRLQRLGGTLALVDPQERVRRLLAVTRLDTVVPVFSRQREHAVSAPADDACVDPPPSAWRLFVTGQGRDLRFVESVRGVLSAATGSPRLDASVSPVVR